VPSSGRVSLPTLVPSCKQHQQQPKQLVNISYLAFYANHSKTQRAVKTIDIDASITGVYVPYRRDPDVLDSNESYELGFIKSDKLGYLLSMR
jgi:hypothetical protein